LPEHRQIPPRDSGGIGAGIKVGMEKPFPSRPPESWLMFPNHTINGFESGLD
jgi:hypothetical protein